MNNLNRKLDCSISIQSPTWTDLFLCGFLCICMSVCMCVCVCVYVCVCRIGAGLHSLPRSPVPAASVSSLVYSFLLHAAHPRPGLPVRWHRYDTHTHTHTHTQTHTDRHTYTQIHR